MSKGNQWLKGNESTCSARGTGDAGSIPGSERSPGEGNGNPLQYSCLENFMDRGICQARVYGDHTTELLSTPKSKKKKQK